jgi:hypothetical protein
MSGSLAAALPAALRHMASECGLAAVMTFIQWRGNSRYYVPRARVGDSHELVIRLGRRAADWLVANHGGETMIVPRAVDMLREQRNREIRALRGQGKSAAEVALQYGLHERGVWRIWAEGECNDEPERTQGGLF